MRRAIEYHMFRYFINDNTQQSFMNKTNKEKMIDRFVSILINNDKIKYNYRKKNYIFYPIHNFDNKLFICKFSKQTKITRHFEGDNDIDIDKESDYPFVYVIISVEGQVILIQRNTSVFAETLIAKNRLVNIFNQCIDKYNYVFKIESISDKEQFWTAVKTAKKVYNLKLKLSAPNLFGARVEANKFMKQQKQSYNLSELELKLSNPDGQLVLTKNNLDDFIEYAVEGGGYYQLKYSDGQEIRKLESKNQSKRILLPNELSESDYDMVMNEIRKVDRLSGMDE